MRRPPEKAVFFLDRCLDHDQLSQALADAGALVERHGSHFAPDSQDTAWIPAVAAKGWAILTKDRRILHDQEETRVWRDAGAAVFAFIAPSARLSVMVEAYIGVLPRMESLLRTHNRPLWARVSPTGQVVIVHGQRRGGVRKDEGAE